MSEPASKKARRAAQAAAANGPVSLSARFGASSFVLPSAAPPPSAFMSLADMEAVQAQASAQAAAEAQAQAICAAAVAAHAAAGGESGTYPSSYGWPGTSGVAVTSSWEADHMAQAAQRMPPRRHKTRMCQHLESGRCRRGDDCTFAHTEDELKQHRNIPFNAKEVSGDPATPQEIEIYLDFNKIQDHAANQFRHLDPMMQRLILDRGSLKYARDPTAVLITRMNQASKGNTSIPGEMRPGDWRCPRCDDVQFARNMECRKCAAPNPAIAAEKASLKLEICKRFINGACMEGDSCKFAHSAEEIKEASTTVGTHLSSSNNGGLDGLENVAQTVDSVTASGASSLATLLSAANAANPLRGSLSSLMPGGLQGGAGWGFPGGR